jgi:hypothetical protein
MADRPPALSKPPPVEPAKLATATQPSWSRGTRRARSSWTAASSAALTVPAT